ncbi:sulfite exporter TauE/SafE family protein [Pseudomonas matsuisoli]|uniref:sulfite exporter TauE/SafE family protein n=1 Tax=Pseudomonas matsuisoli TaxID=1515666 RepID=UPI0016641245|nr:sulfite exporter TauE/SafE family protein [Pseudomonas matsuisoli]
MLSFVLDLLLGVVLGVTGGLFGIGGGLIAIPILGLFFGLDQQMAQGTALVMVVPNVVLAVWRYNQHNRIDLTHAAALAVPGFICAYFGSQWAVNLPPDLMRIGFAFFLLALAVYMLIRLLRGSATGGTTLRHGLPALAALGAVAGVMGGLMAVGSAVVATPGLTGIFGASQVVAQGLSLALALPSTCVTLIVYAWHGQVDWMLGVPLAIGGLLSISWGVKLAHTLPERLLRGLFCGFLAICAVALYLK